MPGELPNLSKTDLFARLAEGHAERITVVTPNRRLAQVLKAEFDAAQAAKGLGVWDDADILPLEAYAARCYEDALYSENPAPGGGLPVLLSDAQARVLWEEAIRGSRWSGALLDVPQTAARAQEAWRLAHAWRIAASLEKSALTEDTRAFAEWSRAYARRLKKDGFVDSPSLADFSFIAGKPKLLVGYAFDVVPPQAKAFLARFECASCVPDRKDPVPKKISFATPREELESAARWARNRLEEGKKRVGIVVPELAQRRREVARVFGRVMGSTAPFELSIGEPLSDYPLVAFALSVLQFSQGEKSYEDASRSLQSPFLGGAQAEMAARAQLDARLRREAGAEISLPKLIGLIDEDVSPRFLFESFFKQSKENGSKPRSPFHWAQHFTALLDAAGFPGERGLDSAEFQARARFNELLGEFARLGLVSSNFSFQSALWQLRRLCAETLFQPEGAGGGGAPVQVLGLLESAGIGFDALWVSGLTDEQWPQRVRPDPFLPAALQRKAGIPESSAEASLALDRRRTEGWLGAAGEVVFSWARSDADRALSPSPLIAQVPDGKLEVPDFPSYRDLIFGQRRTESFTDETAPAFAGRAVAGGTGVLSDQAACPFRAWAHHRMQARALESPEPGLDAMERGNLLHALMAEIWAQVKTSDGLAQDLSTVIAKAADKAVAKLALEGPFAELEKRRLIRLAGEWLDVERTREGFSVVAVERKVEMSIASLSLSGRIDRMDRLADGTHAIIDYKTGRATRSSWMGERPDEPQLPLYAVSAKEEVSVVAFARLRAGEMKFSGYGARGKELPGVEAAKSWPALMQYWKTELEGLAVGYARGDARVEPKKGLATCRNCDLQPLCRVHERLGALDEQVTEGDDS